MRDSSAPLSILADDPYTKIKEYAASFHDALKKLGHGVDDSTSADDETLAVILDKTSVEKLFAMSDKVAAVIGLHDHKLTVALLAVDSSYEIRAEHIKGEKPGQQVWPVRKTVDELTDFFK
jgi:hypothetical protein